MRVALCQIDTTVGDLAGNSARIVAFAQRAKEQGAQLAVFPELALCGYPPEDLLVRPEFLRAHDRALQSLAAAVPQDLPVLLGCVAANEHARATGGRPLHNAAAWLFGGKARIVARKSLLPTYDVFDEGRYFEPWREPGQNVVEHAGVRIGVVICEDGWNDEEFFAERQYPIDPVQEVVRAGAEFVVNLSASPWNLGKDAFRGRMVAFAARRHSVPMLYANLVGGNITLQFDGGTLAVSQNGFAFVPVQWEEAMHVVDTKEHLSWTEQLVERPAPEMHCRAIVQGVRDHAQKFGLPRAVIGLSGGIDSAVVATLAVDALGKDNVAGIAMPSRFSSDHSLEDAKALANNLGIEFHVMPIEPMVAAYESTLAPVFRGGQPGFAEENLQSRVRGALLMAFSNKRGHAVLTTGNKSECAVGYCTLYGDTNGALAPIADLWKTEVWELARFLNRDGERIPLRSIEKPPSAELRPGQLDTDSLPPYHELDPALKLLVEQELSVADVASRTGMARERVAELFAKVQGAEFKRYQYPPTIRVSGRCWEGRCVPVSHRYRER
jgi:NAD+ synthetase